MNHKILKNEKQTQIQLIEKQILIDF